MPGGLPLAVVAVIAGCLPAVVAPSRAQRVGWALLAVVTGAGLAWFYRAADLPALGVGRIVPMAAALSLYALEAMLFSIGAGMGVLRIARSRGWMAPRSIAIACGLGTFALLAVLAVAARSLPARTAAPPPATRTQARTVETSADARSARAERPSDEARSVFGRRVVAAIAAVVKDEDWDSMTAAAERLLSLWHPTVRSEMERRWRAREEARVPPELRGLAKAVPSSVALAYKMQDLETQVPGGVRPEDTFDGAWAGELKPAQARRFASLMKGARGATFWRLDVSRIRNGKRSPFVILYATSEGGRWSLVGYERPPDPR